MSHTTNIAQSMIDLSDYSNSSYPQRNEVDRFGFSWLLANYLGIDSSLPRKAGCSWLHGWKWFPPDDYRYYWFNGRASLYLKTHVVNHVKEALALRSVHGFRTVLVGGLPFAYALRILQECDAKFEFHYECDAARDTCVYLPKCAYDISAARALIEEVTDDTEQALRAVFIVFGDDTKNSDLCSLLESTRIPYLCGSRPDYQYDLLRTVYLLKRFKYLITNSLGSHIPYAASLGLKVRVTSNLRERTPDEFLSYSTQYKYPSWFFERLSWYHSKEYFFGKYSDQFTQDVFSGDLTDWGRHEIGCARVLPRGAIRFALGWNRLGRLNANIKALRFYMSELLQR